MEKPGATKKVLGSRCDDLSAIEFKMVYSRQSEGAGCRVLYVCDDTGIGLVVAHDSWATSIRSPVIDGFCTFALSNGKLSFILAT
jgi:hypothetical protein